MSQGVEERWSVARVLDIGCVTLALPWVTHVLSALGELLLGSNQSA
jgi:2-keto-3-deoxy-L-rhamnonate aldolase RhmA